jgi:hypothetical protein
MPPCRNRILRWMMLPVLLFPPAALAEVRPLLGIGFNQGDDELTIPHLTVLGQGESIYANGGAYVQAGALFYRESPRQYGVRATIGYQYDNSDASNSSATYYVVPIELIPFWELQRARYGVGLAYHVEPRFKATGDIRHLDQRFDDALGIVMQAEWRLHDRFSVGLRYTLIEYHAASQETEIEGNTAGVVFSLSR